MASYKLQIPEPMRAKIKKACNNLGISEAEYIRGAIAAKLRRETRELVKSE